MIGNRIGHFLDPALLKVYRFFCKKKDISPNVVTVIGACLGFVSALLIALDYPRSGGITLLFSGFFDMLDGAIARLVRGVTRFGGFLDSVLDRYTDLFVMFGVFVLFMRQGRTDGLVLTFIATIGIAIIPYARARAEAASIECKTGLMERPERIVVLLLGIFLDLLFYAVTILAVLTHVTVLQRMVFVKRNS